MVKMKKGFWKKTGCILVSASIILTGVTFFDSTVSDAGINADGTTYSFTSDNTTVNAASGLAGNTTLVSIDDTDSCGADIGSGAFANCTSLATVTIFGTASVGANAFQGCTSLKTVYFGAVNSLDTTSFKDCSQLNSLTIADQSGTYTTSDDAIYNGTTLIYVPAGKKSLTVRDGTTAIAAGAFNDSQVSYLEFADASDLGAGSFGTQTGWPLFTDSNYSLTVYASDGAGTEVEDYFDDYVTTYGKTRCKLLFDNSSDDPGSETYTITLKYKLYEADGTTEITLATGTNNTIGTISVDEGNVPTYSDYPAQVKYEGYYYDLLDSNPTPTFVAATADATYYYGYKKTDKQVTSYTITKHLILEDVKNDVHTIVATDIETEEVEANAYPTMPATTHIAEDTGLSYEYASGPTPPFTTANSDAAYHFVYTRNVDSGNGGGSSSTTTYTVTVYDEFYKGDLNHMTSSKIRSVNKYSAGSTYSFSHATYSGYSAYGGRDQSGTVTGNMSAYFFYLENGSSSSTTANSTTTNETNSNLKNIYQITAGANQTVTANGGPVSITCNGDLNKLTGIFLNQKRVDGSRYTLASGSTILTFTDGFMKLFKKGDYVVRFEYTDGYAETGLKVVDSKTTTTVTYKVSSDGSISAGHTKDATPKTADGFDNRYLLCMAFFLLGAGAILFSKQKKLEAILAGERDEE